LVEEVFKEGNTHEFLIDLFICTAKNFIVSIDDPNCEFLTFPTIWCGMKRIWTTSIIPSFNEIVKSQVCRYDRRCAVVRYIFWAFKKLQMRKMNNAVLFALRQCATGQYTADDLLNGAKLERIVSQDEGTIISNLQNSINV